MSGQIITFYSYKGGVGRSMALANIAWLLASNGKRVLMMDWDLEAPGLPRFFAPFLDQNSLASSPGLIEWFDKQRSAAVYPRTGLPRLVEPATLDAVAEPLPFALPVHWSFPAGGRLELVSAGSSGPSYPRLVNDFDWEDFYHHHDGSQVIERLRAALRRAYDYVLIDSRTGVSDISGICTIQAPDAVVICSTLNWQSLNGASRIAEAIDAQRRTNGEPGIRIFPVITRVESAELARLARAREVVIERFARYLWHLPPIAREEYWGAAEIPYIPYYAYEEILCAFGDDPHQVSSMSAAIERITGYLTGGVTRHSTHLNSTERASVLAGFARRPADAGGIKCFLSYSSKDDAFARKLYTDLDRSGIKCWFAPHDLPIGAKIRTGIDEAIKANDKVILVLSANSIASTWVEKEVETAFEREAITGNTILVPLRLDDEVLTTSAGWAADIRRQRNIGDFKLWDDDNAYSAAVDRLVNSLQPPK